MTTWFPATTQPSADHVLPPRWSRSLFRQGPRALTFDIFGFALEPAVLEPDDVHRLVASYLRDDLDRSPHRLGGCDPGGRTNGRRAISRGGTDGPATDRRTIDRRAIDRRAIDRYVSARRLAEDRALAAAAERGRNDVGMPAVTEQLATLIGPGRLDDDPSVANSAIRLEIKLHDDLWQANPVAHRLYRDAVSSGLQIAFLADSPLPRDLVTRMLHRAGYDTDTVLVSSHEGATKASGQLYAAAAARLGEPPSRLTHIGPDPDADGRRAAEAGLRPLVVAPGRRTVIDQVVIGLVDRTGVDAVALALAADRLATVGATATAADVGYYAGGPLAAGFGAFAARSIDELQPDHVVFCGPAADLVDHVTRTIRPSIERRRTTVLGPADGATARAGAAAEVAAVAELEGGERLLVVALGWDDEPHRWLAAELAALGHRTEVAGAYAGRLTPPASGETVRLWAMQGDDRCALTTASADRVRVLTALLAPGGWLDRPGIPQDPMASQLRSGVIAYAEDIASWLGRLPDDCSCALAEPAIRVASSPTETEAVVLGPTVGPWPEAESMTAGDDRRLSRWRRRPPARRRSPRRG